MKQTLLFLLAIAVCGLGPGCSSPNPAYCDQDTPCQDPVYSYCDLTGAHGARNGCVKLVVDGGTSGSGGSDAAQVDLCAGVDCTSLDDECLRGVCDPRTGTCAAEPSSEAEACGTVQECTEYTACTFGSVCGETGVKTRTCVAYTCQAGACVAGDPAQDQAQCVRQTEGLSCGSTLYTSCSSCTYSSTCAQSGSQTCTCTDYSCSSGSCQSSSSSCTRGCTRQTDGVLCNIVGGGQEVCCNNGACNTGC
jgi:hypothetical protein